MAIATDRCPDEAQLLAFFEGTLRFLARRRIEAHLARCDGCRESIALLTRVASGEAAPPLEAGDTVKDQAARVLRMVLRTEESSGLRSGKPFLPPTAVAPIAAFLIIAAGAVVEYRLCLSRSRTEEGLEALRTAVSRNRIPLRISGGLPYAPCAPPAARLDLARFYLARSEPDDLEKALRLLHELRSSAGGSAEVLNETGIANFQSGRYREAVLSFTEALSVDPKMAEALFNKAYTEERVDPRAACQDWERFIASTSDPDWIAEARARLAALRPDGEENVYDQ
jgi:tetratricopeptide (TPR) repeat protein